MSDAAEPLFAADLEAIRRVSVARNRADGLTGLLLYRRPRFYGVLEGPQRRLFARMEVIVTDRRHSALRVLREDSVGERRFSNWSFGNIDDSAYELSKDLPPEDFIRTLARRLW